MESRSAIRRTGPCLENRIYRGSLRGLRVAQLDVSLRTPPRKRERAFCNRLQLAHHGAICAGHSLRSDPAGYFAVTLLASFLSVPVTACLRVPPGQEFAARSACPDYEYGRDSLDYGSPTRTICSMTRITTT